MKPQPSKRYVVHAMGVVVLVTFDADKAGRSMVSPTAQTLRCVRDARAAGRACVAKAQAREGGAVKRRKRKSKYPGQYIVHVHGTTVAVTVLVRLTPKK